MSSTPNKDYTPILKTIKDVNRGVISKIEEERTGIQLGLKTRYPSVNEAAGKYFRFGQVISINGLSGHGKSALLNIVLQDFKNPNINKDFNRDLIIVHNCFEMSPEDEVIREVSSIVEKSHLYLLSSEYQKNKGYNKVSDEELRVIKEFLDTKEDDNHYYFEEPTGVNGILKNVICAIDYYLEKKAIELNCAREHVQLPKVAVALDHTLLVASAKGESVLDTMSSIGRMAIYLKKFGYMVIFVGQFNNEIEKTERIKNPDLHYPMKSDIYAQAQIFNACDIVCTIHQPELLGILAYGKNKYDTRRLIHLQVLKQRFGKVGSIWLENRFDIGKLLPYTPISLLKK